MSGRKIFLILAILARFLFSPKIASSESELVCPYGDGKAIFVTIVSDRILDTIGGVRSFWVYSALPVYEHSVIDDPGRSKVNATAIYPLLWRYWRDGGEDEY
ncbi:MAG: hypothetical protein LBB28_00460, partial [Synergistaceae bacterium]|nr:hypothetical protein [Synergistaceae bacterium]